MTEIPLTLVGPVRVSAETPNGLFLPYGANEPPMLVWNWGNKAHLVRLEGQHAFEYGQVGPGYVARGALITEIELRVDITSRYDALNKSDPLGALVLQDGQIYLIASKAGDPFGDEHEVPLWGGFNTGTKEEKVGFSRWSLAVRDSDKVIIMWSAASVTEDGHIAQTT